MLKLEPLLLPWSTRSISQLFNKIKTVSKTAETPYKPNKLMQFWRTIQYIDKVCITDPPLEIPYLRARRDAVRMALVDNTDIVDNVGTVIEFDLGV